LTNLHFKVEVPQKLRSFLENPTPIVNKYMKQADKLALTLLRESIKTNAPKGKTGKLRASIVIDLAERKVATNLVYGRAIELGHYAEAKPGHYLRFPGNAQRTGISVFPTTHFKGAKGYESLKGQWVSAVRFKKNPYFFRSINQNRQQVLEIYEEVFEKIKWEYHL
jgi:hypothetical protein